MIAALPQPRHPLADLVGWEDRVRLMVRPKRYQHVLRVAELACQIACANGLDESRAYAAGILHDIARDLPDAELLRLAPPEHPIDAAHPLALHGRAARTLLERWGYCDAVVLEAVEDHTTGPRGGNPVSACVYVADVSEPGRGVNEDIRELALHDLDAALHRAIASKVTYLQGRGIQVHPRTLQAYYALPLVRVDHGNAASDSTPASDASSSEPLTPRLSLRRNRPAS
ncbi:bis(5'-nucleosyl)-tetraphosphatase (symmetrical) YqeK [Deinococcus oregonensis]|uniref:bis(5'-nucleosyl)-tetraphosphatase (symmetrical) n=1 Tax=Deinococcus oregonensis TaxID=1805970 RepID=A0ABV6AWI5_9DEIO